MEAPYLTEIISLFHQVNCTNAKDGITSSRTTYITNKSIKPKCFKTEHVSFKTFRLYGQDLVSKQSQFTRFKGN